MLKPVIYTFILWLLPPLTCQAKQMELTILAAGDSLTAGFGINPEDNYPSLLEKKLRKSGHRVTVINGGISGETSGDLLARIDTLLMLQPDIVIIETGINDNLRGIPADFTETNIAAILARLSDEGITVILTGMKMAGKTGECLPEAFHAIYSKLAEKTKVIYMPFFLEGVKGNKDLELPDRLHPNAKGYAVIVENLYPYVLEAIKSLSDTNSSQ